MSDPIWGDVPEWRRTLGRENYVRGLSELARVLGCGPGVAKRLIEKGEIKAYKFGTITFVRLDEIKRHMVETYGTKEKITEPSDVIKRLEWSARDELIFLWLSSDTRGRLSEHITRENFFSLVRDNPLIVEARRAKFELTDLAYDVVHALLSSDLVRYQNFEPPPRWKKYNAGKRIPIRTSHAQFELLLKMRDAPPLTAQDLIDLGAHKATITTLRDRGLIRVKHRHGDAYTITKKGREALEN